MIKHASLHEHFQESGVPPDAGTMPSGSLNPEMTATHQEDAVCFLYQFLRNGPGRALRVCSHKFCREETGGMLSNLGSCLIAVLQPHTIVVITIIIIMVIMVSKLVPIF